MQKRNNNYSYGESSRNKNYAVNINKGYSLNLQLIGLSDKFGKTFLKEKDGVKIVSLTGDEFKKLRNMQGIVSIKEA